MIPPLNKGTVYTFKVGSGHAGIYGKYIGRDDTSNWLLIEMTNILKQTVVEILNPVSIVSISKAPVAEG